MPGPKSVSSPILMGTENMNVGRRLDPSSQREGIIETKIDCTCYCKGMTTSRYVHAGTHSLEVICISRHRSTSHATFSTQRGSWGREDLLLGTTGLASLVIFQIISFSEGENRKDSIKMERTTSKGWQYLEAR